MSTPTFFKIVTLEDFLLWVFCLELLSDPPRHAGNNYATISEKNFQVFVNDFERYRYEIESAWRTYDEPTHGGWLPFSDGRFQCVPAALFVEASMYLQAVTTPKEKSACT